MVTAHLHITSLISILLNYWWHSPLPWPSKHGCIHLVCDYIMNIYGDIAENVYFDNGGTNLRFYDILTSLIFPDFLYVFLVGFLKHMASKVIMLHFFLGWPFFEHRMSVLSGSSPATAFLSQSPPWQLFNSYALKYFNAEICLWYKSRDQGVFINLKSS